MSRNIIIAKGVFSKLSITLNDDTIGQLALIDKKNNPLSKIESDLSRLLVRFEEEYSKIIRGAIQ